MTNTTNTPAIAPLSAVELDKLEALARAATDGPWDTETVRSEGEYGTDEDGGHGFDAYAVVDSKGRPMFDSLNRDDSMIATDTDGDVFYAWDELAKRDAQFIAAANPAAILALIAQARLAAQPVVAKTIYEQCTNADCGRFKDGAGWSCRARRDGACQAEHEDRDLRLDELEARRAALAAPVAAQADTTEPSAGELTDLMTYPSPHGTLVRLADVKCWVMKTTRTPTTSAGEADTTASVSPAAPAEFVLVPVMPTTEMILCFNLYSDADDVRAAWSSALAAAAAPVSQAVEQPADDAEDARWLPQINEDLVTILGRPNFTCIRIAERLRQMGDDIPRKAEYEQAHVIYLLLSMYLEHGKSWVAKANDFLKPDEDVERAAIPTAKPEGA